MCVAPARAATRGVATRAWSLASPVASWMPGVTISIPPGRTLRKVCHKLGFTFHGETGAVKVL